MKFLSIRARSYIRFAVPALEHLRLLKPRSFGLNGLDRKLLEHVYGRNGIFVEAGANDGLSQSNTAYYELYLGWRGLLVEPIPELAAKCRANRTRSTVAEVALVAANDTRRSASMTYCNLMSIVDGARGGAEQDAAHVESGTRFLAPNDTVRRVEVVTSTLADLVRQHGFERVDLLSLDVEGYEAQALLGMDFDELAPMWILVEANDRDAVHAVLAPRYDLVGDLSHHDRLYRLR